MSPPQILLANPPRRRRRPSAWVVAALTLTQAACSGGQASSPATTTTTEATEAVRSVDVGVTVTVHGFDVTVTEMTSALDGAERTVAVVSMQIDNPSGSEAVAALDLTLRTTAGERAPIEVDEPLVERGDSAGATATFSIDDADEAFGSQLVLGAAGRNRAVVEIPHPAGDDTGDDTDPSSRLGDSTVEHPWGDPTLRPRTVSVGTLVIVGGMRVAVTSVEIRADDPMARTQLLEGRALVIATFDVTRAGGATPNLGSANLRWRLPDGTAVPVRDDGRSGPNLVLAPRESAAGVVVRFEVPAPVTGTHALVVVGPFGDLAQTERAEAPIDLTPAP